MDLLQQNRTYHEAQTSMERLPNYYSWMYGKFNQYLSGEVVELGCGSGMGIATYINQASTVFAVDHNDELLRRVSSRFQSDKIEAITADLIGDWHELAEINSDAVIMMDVLEHFQDDVTFLKKAASLLKPSGHLIVKVPAQRSLYSEMDQASGHFRRYDPVDLKKLAEEAGLSLVFIKHINPVGAFVYRLKNKKNTNLSKTFSPLQLKVINTLLPLLRIGDFLSFIPGLSLIAVMKKK